ncbi:MAG: outer membrane lipoprotein-sorting protein [Myxococcaceae bacterium]|nr:outer membrane lipoprotein-sorting protein [Myxococcaceae bacterium]
MRSSLLAAVLLAAPVLAAEPTVEQLLKKYDDVMGPASYEAETTMTATREDGSTRTYVMKFIKRDADKFRLWFADPAAVKGQEILRNGDNSWIYLPSLKRATRLANRDSFQGGDFNNADVLRVNYQADYTGTLVESDSPDAYCMELKAKSPETAYDKIRLWIRKKDQQPLKGQYFGTSGQLIRSAEFLEHKELDKGYVRPTRIVMHNELVKARQSEMVMKSLKLNVDLPPQRFSQSDLGK